MLNKFLIFPLKTINIYQTSFLCTKLFFLNAKIIYIHWLSV